MIFFRNCGVIDEILEFFFKFYNEIRLLALFFLRIGLILLEKLEEIVQALVAVFVVQVDHKSERCDIKNIDLVLFTKMGQISYQVLLI